MALTKATPAFETEAETEATVETTATPVAAPAPAAKPTTAVATQGTRAVAGFSGITNPITALKDAVKVSYDSLTSIVASNGNFLERETKKSVGDEIVFELLSWQDSFVVQAGDDKAPKETVRYSDDGIVCSDGTLVKDHLEELRNMGYEKASIKERAVVVGSVISCTKGPQLVDDLVQFDLSPKSKGKFSRYQLLALNALRLGKATPEQVTRVRAHTELATAGNNTYTVVVFEIAP
jgi:hypothetical protein